MKNNSIPRRKRMNRKARLSSAKNWIKNYTGRHIIKGYARWYKVDLRCAIKELRLNNVKISIENEIAIRKNIDSSAKKSTKSTKVPLLVDYAGEEYKDGDFAFIAGYTSLGVPYGIMNWEEE